MNRFKKTIATAVSTLMIVMAFALLAVGEAEAKGKTPFDKSYLPPAARAKAQRSSFYGTGVYRLRARSVAVGDFNHDGRLDRRRARRLGILPYIEQDNLYK